MRGKWEIFFCVLHDLLAIYIFAQIVFMNNFVVLLALQIYLQSIYILIALLLHLCVHTILDKGSSLYISGNGN